MKEKQDRTELHEIPLNAKDAAALMDNRLPGTGFGRTDRNPNAGVMKLYTLASRGVIPCLTIGRRRYWFASALERWIDVGGGSFAGGWKTQATMIVLDKSATASPR